MTNSRSERTAQDPLSRLRVSHRVPFAGPSPEETASEATDSSTFAVETSWSRRIRSGAGIVGLRQTIRSTPSVNAPVAGDHARTSWRASHTKMQVHNARRAVFALKPSIRCPSGVALPGCSAQPH